jgi:hypothetical protein
MVRGRVGWTGTPSGALSTESLIITLVLLVDSLDTLQLAALDFALHHYYKQQGSVHMKLSVSENVDAFPAFNLVPFKQYLITTDPSSSSLTR